MTMSETKYLNITTIAPVLLLVIVGASAAYEYMQLQSVTNLLVKVGFGTGGNLTAGIEALQNQIY